MELIIVVHVYVGGNVDRGRIIYPTHCSSLMCKDCNQPMLNCECNSTYDNGKEIKYCIFKNI